MLWLPALAAALAAWGAVAALVLFTGDLSPALRLALRALAVLAGGYVTWCALLFGAQRLVLFPGTRLPPAGPRPTLPDARPLDVTHAEGVSEGWFMPGLGLDAEHPGPVVIYAHGNGERVDDQLGWLRGYADRGVSVASLEYRGYGRSGGAPSEAALVADAEAFVAQVARQPEVNRYQIIYHGRSLGGGVLGALHGRRPAAGLILESTFTSARALARRFGVPGALLRDGFETQAALAARPAPTLVLHGRRDEVIPFAHGQALAATAQTALVARDCGHNDCPMDAVYWVELLGLVERVTQR